MSSYFLKIFFGLMPLGLGMGLALDIYVPAIPKMAHSLNASHQAAQMTMSAFMIAFGLGQLIMGPLSDKFGRKIVSFLSIILYIISSYFCAISDSVYEMIFYRVIQAIASCGMFVCAFAIVRDVFEKKERATAYSHLNGVISFSPVIAPSIGSLLDLAFGWRSLFYALAGFGIVALILNLIFIRDTRRSPYERKKGFLSIYKKVLKNKSFCFFSISSAAGGGCLFIYFSTSPFFMIENIGISQAKFSFLFGINAFTFLLASILCGQKINKWGILSTLKKGQHLLFLGGVAMMLLSLLSPQDEIISCVIPMLIASVGTSFLFAASTTGALEDFPNDAGSAFSVLGFIQFIFAGIAGNLVMFGSELKTALPIGIGLTGLAVMCYIGNIFLAPKDF